MKRALYSLIIGFCIFFLNSPLIHARFNSPIHTPDLLLLQKVNKPSHVNDSAKRKTHLITHAVLLNETGEAACFVNTEGKPELRDLNPKDNRAFFFLPVSSFDLEELQVRPCRLIEEEKVIEIVQNPEVSNRNHTGSFLLVSNFFSNFTTMSSNYGLLAIAAAALIPVAISNIFYESDIFGDGDEDYEDDGKINEEDGKINEEDGKINEKDGKINEKDIERLLKEFFKQFVNGPTNVEELLEELDRYPLTLLKKLELEELDKLLSEADRFIFTAQVRAYIEDALDVIKSEVDDIEEFIIDLNNEKMKRENRVGKLETQKTKLEELSNDIAEFEHHIKLWLDTIKILESILARLEWENWETLSGLVKSYEQDVRDFLDSAEYLDELRKQLQWKNQDPEISKLVKAHKNDIRSLLDSLGQLQEIQEQLEWGESEEAVMKANEAYIEEQKKKILKVLWDRIHIHIALVPPPKSVGMYKKIDMYKVGLSIIGKRFESL